MHPKPLPVKLSPKVARALAEEASLDVDWEGMHEGDPAALIATYERIGHDIEYIRLLLTGELTEAWSVLRAQKELRKEWERIASFIGEEMLCSGVRARDRKKGIKKLRRQARRLRAASRDCSRFWEEWLEWKHDREASERLGLDAEEGVVRDG